MTSPFRLMALLLVSTLTFACSTQEGSKPPSTKKVAKDEDGETKETKKKKKANADDDSASDDSSDDGGIDGEDEGGETGGTGTGSASPSPGPAPGPAPAPAPAPTPAPGPAPGPAPAPASQTIEHQTPFGPVTATVSNTCTAANILALECRSAAARFCNALNETSGLMVEAALDSALTGNAVVMCAKNAVFHNETLGVVSDTVQRNCTAATIDGFVCRAAFNRRCAALGQAGGFMTEAQLNADFNSPVFFACVPTGQAITVPLATVTATVAGACQANAIHSFACQSAGSRTCAQRGFKTGQLIEFDGTNAVLFCF